MSRAFWLIEASGRGYNIESLTVSEVDGLRFSRISASGIMVIEQINKLLARLVPVHVVEDLTTGPCRAQARWLK